MGCNCLQMFSLFCFESFLLLKGMFTTYLSCWSSLYPLIICLHIRNLVLKQGGCKFIKLNLLADEAYMLLSLEKPQ